MRDLLEAFIQAINDPKARVRLEEVELFMTNFPGGVSDTNAKKLRAACQRRFGRTPFGMQGVSPEPSKAVLNESEEPFLRLVPKSGFLRLFLEYTKGLEAPAEFWFFTGAVILGMAIGRSRYIPRAGDPIYAPFPVLLVGPSGVVRKTSAAKLATKLARSVGISVLANKATPEAIADLLQTTKKGGNTLIYAPELAVMFGKQKYNDGLIAMLTDLFDCPDLWENTTITGGMRRLENVSLGAILCTTVRWMKTSIPTEAFAGGMMSRLLIVSKESTIRCFPDPPELDESIWWEMQGMLRAYQEQEGTVEFSPPAKKWYTAWYQEEKHKAQQAGEDFIGYHSRRPTHLLRLAMLWQLSHNESVLTQDSLEAALGLLRWIEEGAPKVIQSLFLSEFGEAQQAVLLTLRRAGGLVTKNDLIKELSKQMSRGVLQEALSTLLASNQLGKMDSPTQGGEACYFLKNWGDT